MESFVVSALKYRPTSFEEVVGQESITKTLQNSLDSNQLAQAFSFVVLGALEKHHALGS